MLTCVYHPPVSLVSTSAPQLNKNCMIRVNREVDTRKVMVSKFTEDKSGRVKVETNSTNKTLNQILRARHKSGSSSSSSSSSTCSNSSLTYRKGRNSSENSLNNWNNNDDSWESAYSSDSEPVRERHFIHKMSSITRAQISVCTSFNILAQASQSAGYQRLCPFRTWDHLAQIREKDN